MALKTYSLVIVYDPEQDDIEYIEEYISGTDKPIFVQTPTKITVDDEYWEMCDGSEAGES